MTHIILNEFKIQVFMKMTYAELVALRGLQSKNVAVGGLLTLEWSLRKV